MGRIQVETHRRTRERDLVLVGGGHSHVQVLRALAMNPIPGARLTLVVDRPIAIYSGMVPGFVAGQYRVEELEIDVVPLARRAGARVILAPALRFDAQGRRIHFLDRPPIRYHVASVDIGSTVAGLDLPGIRQHALPTRPIAALVQRVEEVVEAARRRPPGSPFRVVVVGGGAGGVELAFTLWHRLDGARDPHIAFTLIHALPRILTGYPESLVARVHRLAAARGIDIICGRQVVSAGENQLHLDNGQTMAQEALVWVTGAVSHPVFTRSGLPTDERGFVRTRATLQVEGFDDLFAAGDCATMSDYPETPKAGVYAVRQGPYLIENIRRLMEGRRLRRYRPQSDFLTLLNLGDGSALGAKWGLSVEGPWVMRLKDRIDRRFVRRFQVLDLEGGMTEEFAKLPDMSRQMELLCGGCAAKVGQTVLDRVLERLGPPPEDPSVRLGLQVPDDASAYATPSGEVVVSSVDAFRAFTEDPYLVGRVAAVNALSDLYATGAEPRYALALIAIPKDAEDDEAEEVLFQVLAGVRQVLDEAGVTLLGGHTTTAPELLVGLSVDGFAGSSGLLSIDRLAVDDILVLTKRLGTGVILHADMQGRARGAWLEGALASMLGSNGPAARLAGQAGALAMTDVTGFGLVGHLGEMLRASGVSARLDVAGLPALPGALELLERGFRSTFHAQNEKAKKGILIRREAARLARLELLFDPQTSGGLLFGLPAEKVPEVLRRLRAAGEEATIIGTVTPRRADGALMEVGAGGREPASGPAEPNLMMETPTVSSSG